MKKSELEKLVAKLEKVSNNPRSYPAVELSELLRKAAVVINDKIMEIDENVSA